MTDDGEGSTSHSMSPDSMDEDRPLKKARYVWQIKGRYRLGHRRTQSCRRSRQRQRLSPVSAPASTSQTNTPLDNWQIRQLTRAMIDNTINVVLEDMGFDPSSSSDNEVDFNSIDIFPEMNSIENQAVLMAIESHGLQKPCHCSHSLSLPLSSVPNIPFHRRPSSPLVEDVEQVTPDICEPSTSEPQEKYTGETDFLAQAVAVAIQKKGLGSFSQTEYS